jgi:hypothetical protein
MALIHDAETGTGFGTDQQLGDLYYNFEILSNPDSDEVTVKTLDGQNSNMVLIKTPGKARGILYVNDNDTDPKTSWVPFNTVSDGGTIAVVPT